MPTEAHPPNPGPMVRPNFVPIMDALHGVPFPISKRELLDQVEDDTVLFRGRNAALHDLIKELRDDYFFTEEEFLDALESEFGLAEEEA